MEKLFLTVLNMSLTASILVIAALFVRLLLKRAPRWISCMLWGIVAVRLICPLSFESIFSLIPSAEPIPQEIIVMEHPQVTTGIYVLNHVVNPIISDSFAANPAESVNPMQIVVRGSSYIWIFGVFGLFVYAMISYLLLYKKVQGSISFGKRVKICDYIETPFILGIIRPSIFVPSGLSDEQFAYVIAHENAHLKRFDHLWKPIGFLILAIHWFNPFAWIAYIMLCKDIEIACDEKVIHDMGKQNAASYAQALLECSRERRFVLMCPLAFGEVSVKERIKHILQFKKPTFWIIVVAIVSCIIIAVCFLTNPKKGGEPLLQDNQNIEDEWNTDKPSQQDISLLNEGANVDITENSMTLENAIDQAIVEHGSKYAPASSASNYKVASFVELRKAMTDGTVEEISVYGMAMYMEANVNEEGIQETSGLHMPVVLTFEAVDGKYDLKEYWEPGEGSYYGESMKEKFPADVLDIAMDSQSTVYQQTMDCYNQIICQSGLNTEPVVEELLNKICSPSVSSSTTDYINNSPIEFRELIYYGQYTLQYRNEYLGSMQNLQAEVMEEACKRIMELNDLFFTPSDIYSLTEIDVVLPDGALHVVSDPQIIDKIEEMLSNATEIKGVACPSNATVYLHREDGAVGEIFPAADSCDNFNMNGRYYDFGTGDNTEFWELLGQTEELQQNNDVVLTVFYGNDTAEFLLSKTVMVPKISPDEIIGQLKEAQVFSDDVTLLHMEIGSDGCMSLNFNSAFGQQLAMYGSAGEYLMLGSTVNTFLAAFPECDCARILIESEPCSYGQMDYSQPFTYFANADTTILASIAIEGNEQEIEMSRIAAAPGFAINYDRERFVLKEEVSGMISLIAKAGSLTAQLDCWRIEGLASVTVSELKDWEFGTNVREEHVILEQQGYDAVKLSEKENGADVRTEDYVIADGSASWVIRLKYSTEAEEGLLPELMYTLNSFQILH